MSSQKHSRNLAARMGRWSAHHHKLAIFGWLAFVAASFAIGMIVVGAKQATDASGPGESGRASAILEEGFKQPAGETVLIQSDSLRVGDRAFDAAIRDVMRLLVAEDAVTNIRSPLDPENAGQISADRRSALIDFQIRGDADLAVDEIDPILAGVAAVQAAHPRLFVGEFGDASADKQLEASFMSDLRKAGLYSVPVTLVILLLVFGALVAAGIPLLLALTAVLATVGLWALPSQIWPSDEALYAMVLLIGLAVGVDYSMFYLKREREERAAGRSAEAALEAAAATSGRSVLVSGATVIVAMAGMLFAGDVFAPFGVATMLVVAVAVLGSLTVLPAVLSMLGDNVDRLRIPFVHRLSRDDGEGRIWGAIVDRVLRRPLLSLVLAGGLLLAIAAPALTIHTAEPGIDTYPQGLGVLKTYNRLQAAFPGTEIPANVVVKAAEIDSAEVQGAIAQLKRRALATGLMHQPIVVDVNRDSTVANVAIPIDGTGNDGPSNAALAALRGEIVPETVGSVTGVETAVGGFAAESKDSNDELKSVAPFVFAFVLGFAFLLLLFAFRSLVIAAKAIILNLLSVAAAYGILVLVFQHGWGKQLLGFETTGGIAPFLPIFLFVILFGLSMDYHVFILSRIREAYDGGASTEDAVAHGIKSTAGVITSAALVMVCVFSIFGVLSFMMFKQIGVGLAAAILVDATIVRAVLLPATMKLLGDWNWYLPSWLEWLPHLEHQGEVEALEPLPAPTPST
ncbi:MAG TPA: MMPL family transporter [Gaiellaceae bacterium]|nr:MMPL family transporter [Gaiellaceae bacterium]